MRLWRIVISLAEEATTYFNVRCKVCNQLEYVERGFGIKNHKVTWSTSTEKQGWIGVDFDGTLADFGCDWTGDYRATGSPIPAMVMKVKQWLADGEDVRIFTARMDCFHPTYLNLMEWEVKKPIEEWCKEHLGKVLPITNRKDHWCKAIYDDRAYHVEKNTGRITEETE